MHALPLETAAVERKITHGPVQSPASGRVHFFTTDENPIVAAAKLVDNCRIFLVDQVLVHVFELELVGVVGNQF